MLILIAGLVLFLGTHAFTMAREPRAALIGRIGAGPYRGLYSLVSLIGLVLIVYGFGAYRASGYVPLWDPPVWTRHLALTLMPISFVLLAASQTGGRIRRAVKHPMLAAVKIWAFSHLLANGDLGSVLLFGLFLAYAVVDRIAVKRRAPEAHAHEEVVVSGWRADIAAVVIGLGLYVAFALWLHPVLIGVPVMPGR